MVHAVTRAIVVIRARTRITPKARAHGTVASKVVTLDNDT